MDPEGAHGLYEKIKDQADEIVRLNLALVEAWKGTPEGTPVILTKDDGTDFHTKTRSIPWMLGADNRPPSDWTHCPGHTAVILVEGLTGGWSLQRLRRA